MKRSGIDHPKFKKLAQLLGVRLHVAIGVCEMIYHFTSKHAIQGDIGKWSDEEIAEAVDWAHEGAQTLIKALIDAKLLDASDKHRLVVHDWHEHTDDSTKKTMKNRNLEFVTVSVKRKRKKVFRNDSGNVPENSGMIPDDSGNIRNDSGLLSFPSLSFPEPSQAKPDAPPEIDLAAKRGEVGATCHPSMVPIPADLSTPQFTATWNRWCEYLRQRLPRVSQIALVEQLRTMTSWGVERSIAAMEYSIRNNSQGLYEPNSAGGSSSRAPPAKPKRSIAEIARDNPELFQ